MESDSDYGGDEDKELTIQTEKNYKKEDEVPMHV